MSDKLDSIINNIAELSVLELSELVKALEDKFGVTAAAPMAFAAAPAGAAAPAEDAEPTAFDVILKEVGREGSCGSGPERSQGSCGRRPEGDQEGPEQGRRGQAEGSA